YAQARGRNPFGCCIGRHHVHATEVVDPGKQEEATVENTTGQEQIVHSGLRDGLSRVYQECLFMDSYTPPTPPATRRSSPPPSLGPAPPPRSAPPAAPPHPAPPRR